MRHVFIAAVITIIASISYAEPTAQPAKPVRGAILRVEKDQFTVKVLINNQPAETTTFLLDDNTHIYVCRVKDRQTTPDGRDKRKFDLKSGKRDDLKVGVLVWINADGQKASVINVMIDDPK